MPLKRILLAETHQTFVGVVRLILKDTGRTMLKAGDELSVAEAATNSSVSDLPGWQCAPIASSVELFRCIEEWATLRNWGDHQHSDLFTVLRGGSLMQRPPEIVLHTVSHTAELEA